MTQRSPKPRRTSDQWQTLVEQWRHSGLSARQFCQEQRLGYASFCQWRKRFADATVNDPPSEPKASFIDLSALSQASKPSRWRIVLSLGNGVELTLSQS